MKVKKQFTDEQMEALKNTFVKRDHIHTIIKKDAEVYTEDGKLLLFFRKKKLNGAQEFYEQIGEYTKKNPSTSRGSASGSEFKFIGEHPKIKTVISGYFDRWSPAQKVLFKKKGMKIPLEVRETIFTAYNPEKFQKMIPFIKQIDDLYKKYLPEYYEKQARKSRETPFKIADTAFTTVTTNINFQTTIHTDKGDDEEGFGNLAVVERGKYTGGETCLPQYGVGVDVREGDILFMNVHEWHGNLPMKFEKDAERMSIVCYLRKRVWERTKHKSKRFMKLHNKTVKSIRK